MNKRLLDRFVRYAAVCTTSDPDSDTYPSTPGQWELLRLLESELTALGCSEVVLDEWGYLTATILATVEGEPTIGLFAHVDTSPDMSGGGVEVQINEHYDPSKPLRLGATDYYLRSEDFSELLRLKGHTLLTTRGETLLGADDKAGVAILVTLAEELLTQKPPHGRVRLCFTPDEEIGRGVDHFDVAAFGADFAYTLDSGALGMFEYENFNAAEAILTVDGRNIHPGYAKGKMVNALQELHDIHRALPEDQRPETTEGREGFFHLNRIEGTVDRATAHYIIRDHDRAAFEAKKALLVALCPSAEIRDQYYNMRQVLDQHPQVVERALEAMKAEGITPRVEPIRGGTDGARLSFMGLPCPNLFTGMGNMHSRYEYLSLNEATAALRALLRLV